MSCKPFTCALSEMERTELRPTELVVLFRAPLCEVLLAGRVAGLRAGLHLMMLRFDGHRKDTFEADGRSGCARVGGVPRG